MESIDELRYHVEGCAVRMDKLIHAIRRRTSMIEERLFDDEERIARIVEAYADPMDRFREDEELTDVFCNGCPRRYEPIDGPMDCDITPRHADCPRNRRWRRIEDAWGVARTALADALRGEAAP